MEKNTNQRFPLATNQHKIMKEELELWRSIQKECVESLKRHGAILEAITDRGQAVIRKNPALEALAKAEKKVAELEKLVGSELNLD